MARKIRVELITKTELQEAIFQVLDLNCSTGMTASIIAMALENYCIVASPEEVELILFELMSKDKKRRIIKTNNFFHLHPKL